MYFVGILHQMHVHPYFHRAVASRNCLLERFACAPARGSCTFAALSPLGQVRRAGSAGASEKSSNLFGSGPLDWTAAAAGSLNSSESAAC
jgi:hypothetical protein